MAGTKPQASEASAARPPSMAYAVSIMSLCSLEKTRDPETSGYTATGSLPLDRAAGRDSVPTRSCDHPCSARGRMRAHCVMKPQGKARATPGYIPTISLKEEMPPLQKPCHRHLWFEPIQLPSPVSPESRTFLPRGNSFHEDWMGLSLLLWLHDTGLANQ